MALGGDYWTTNTNWLNRDVPVTSWYGIGQSQGSYSIALNSSGLNGEKSEMFWGLDHLTGNSRCRHNSSIYLSIGSSALHFHCKQPNTRYSTVCVKIVCSQIVNSVNLPRNDPFLSVHIIHSAIFVTAEQLPHRLSCPTLVNSSVFILSLFFCKQDSSRHPVFLGRR